VSQKAESPRKILNLVIAAVDAQSVQAKPDAVAVVLHGPSPDNPPLRAVLSVGVAEALADALRAGLAAARRLRAGGLAAAMPRLARFQIKVHSEQPVALVQLQLDDGREFTIGANPRDLAAMRQALDEALGTAAEGKQLPAMH